MPTPIRTSAPGASNPLATGIRTTATARPQAGPDGLPARVLALWNGLSLSMKRLAIAGVMTVVLVVAACSLHSSVNRPVALYSTALSATDLQDVTARLDQLRISYTLEGSKVLVPPDQRTRAIGLLVASGLPRRPPVADPAEGETFPGPNKPRLENLRKEREMVDALRQFEMITDARVTIVPMQEDVLPTPGDNGSARATVLLTLKSGAQPSRTQVQAILNLVSYSVRGLSPDQVRITDTEGRVWNDGQKILGSGTDPARNDLLELKLATEQQYREKIENALTRMVGANAFIVGINTDLDFSHTKIVELRYADAAGTNTASTRQTTEKVIYDGGTASRPSLDPSEPEAPSPAPTPGARKTGANERPLQEHYVKIRDTRDAQTGRIERTAVLEPGAVRRVTATVVVDGQHSASDVEAIRDFAASTVGYDPSRGDELWVRCYPFHHPAVAPPPPSEPISGHALPSSNSWLVSALFAQVAILLAFFGIFSHRSRAARAQGAAPVLVPASAAGAVGIADLEARKDGRSPDPTVTTRSRFDSLDRMAREKPTKIAELLKSTWLSDQER